MSTADPNPAPAKPQTNAIGKTIDAYKGSPSTLCPGCGHESVTNQLVRALFESNIDPYSVAKISGIGCSSKTTAYFMGGSHGFNGVHGRAAAVATGSYLANHKLLHIVVSGDGDTASIGLGNFMHMVRRNVPLVYVIENNGVYGLTKGQLSATADKGTPNKRGVANHEEPIDCCALAIQMGCEYVARSFSGDVKQLLALLKGAIAHPGTSVIDVISPCVTFGAHEGFTKSLKYAREHQEPLHQVSFQRPEDGKPVEFDPGTTRRVDLPDGSCLLLSKLGAEYDPSDPIAAMAALLKANQERRLITGLIYHRPDTSPHMGKQYSLIDTPLAHLTDDKVRPHPEVLQEIMETFV